MVQNQTYKKNDILVVLDKSQLHAFTLACLIETPKSKAITLRLILLKRIQDQIYQFVPDKETEIPASKILMTAKNVKITKKDNQLKATLSNQYYQKIRKEVNDLVGVQEDSEEEEVSEEELVEGMADAVVKQKIKIKGARKDAFEDKVNFKYKKGKENILVEETEFNQQYERKSSMPDFSCCVSCNNQEIIRAIKTNDFDLLKNILREAEQKSLISDVQPNQEHIGGKGIIYLCLKLQRYQMLDFILLKDNIKHIKNASSVQGFRYIDTGRNDKFAYGYELARVELSRGKAEGNNAFIYDQQNYHIQRDYFVNDFSTFKTMKMMQELHDKGMIDRIDMQHQHQLVEDFKRNFQWIILMGNHILAQYFAEIMFKHGGYGFNDFHSLALTAKTVEELVNLKRMNVGKKANDQIDQVTPFHCSVLNPNPEIFLKFIEIGQDLFVADIKQRKAMHYAAGAPHIHALEILFRNGVDGRETDINKSTPLMYASMAGRVENIRFLLKNYNYNINQKDKKGFNSLHYAVTYDHFESVKELLKQGADVNLLASKGKSVIILAAVNGNLEIIKHLILNGAKFMKTDAYKRSPLIYAVINGHVDVVSYLLRKGADYDGPDSSNNFPIHYACAYGRVQMIEMLVQAGANLNQMNNWGFSPLLVALVKQHKMCVEKMLSFPQIDVNIRDNKGRGFLFGLVHQFSEDNFMFLERLIRERGGDPNQKDLAGNQLMHELARVKFEGVQSSMENYLKSVLGRDDVLSKEKFAKVLQKYFKLLQKSGCSLSSKNIEGFTPVEIALKENNLFFLNLILQSDDLIFDADESKEVTELHYPCIFISEVKGHELLERFLKKIRNLPKYEAVYHKVTGFNFLHEIVDRFCSLSKNKWSAARTQVQVWINYLNQGIQDVGGHFLRLNLTPQEQKVLEKEKLILEKHLEELPSLLDQNFMKILKLLRDCKCNFLVKVKPISVLASQFMEIPTSAYETLQNIQDRALSHQKLEDITFINDAAGDNCLMLLMKNPEIEVLKILFDFFSKQSNTFVNDVNNFNQNVVFHYFKHKNQAIDILDFLVKKGFNINTPDASLQYPLLMITEYSSFEFFEQFLKYPSLDLEVQNKDKENCLLLVCKQRNIKKLRLLIQRGCRMNQTDSRGRNALHWAINNNVNVDSDFSFEEILIENQVNMNQRDDMMRTPVFYFFVKINDTVKEFDPIENYQNYVLYGQCDQNLQDIEGNTFLHYAAQADSFLCINQTIKEKNFNPNLLNKDGNSILNICLLHQRFNTCLMLLQHKIDVSHKIVIVDQQMKKHYQKLLKKRTKMEIQDRKFNIRWSEWTDSKLQLKVFKFLFKETDRDFFHLKLKDQFSNNDKFNNQDYWTGNNCIRFFQLRSQLGFYQQNVIQKLNEKQLEGLAKQNFVTQRLSPFVYSLEKKQMSLPYLLLESDFSLHQAIIDCISLKYFTYAFKLLNKKKFLNQKEQVQYLNQVDKDQKNLLHHFACNSTNQEDAEKVFDKLCDLNFDFNQKDSKNKTPLFYALENGNLYLAIKMMTLRKCEMNLLEKESNNSLLSSFLAFNLAFLQRQNLSSQNDAVQNNNVPTQFQSMNVPSEILQLNFPSQIQNNKAPRKYARKIATVAEGNENAIKEATNQDTENIEDNLDRLKQNSLPNVLKMISYLTRQKNMPLNNLFTYQKKSYSLLSFSLLVLKNLQLFKLLLKEGADINQEDEVGRTIVHLSLRLNNKHLFTCLRDYEKDIDFKKTDNKGSSLIHYVVKPLSFGSYRNTEILEYLSKHCDLNKQNNEGLSPLDIALNDNNQVMINKLNELGVRKARNQMIIEEETEQGFVELECAEFDVEDDYEKFMKSLEKKIPKNDLIVNNQELDSRFGENIEKVFNEQNELYDVQLVKIDIKYGQYSKNVYYKMQVGRDKIRNIFVLFTNWGRIGTPGQFQLTPFFHLKECLKEFELIFKQKTGNEYSQRDDFVKKQNKYQFVKPVTQYDDKRIVYLLQNQFIFGQEKKSSLPEQIRNLIKSQFDWDFLKTIYKNQNQINTQVHSFGSIDVNNYHRAFEILNQMMVKLGQTNLQGQELRDKYTSLLELSEEIYELIPMVHNPIGSLILVDQTYINQYLPKIKAFISYHFLERTMMASFYRHKEINPIDYTYHTLKRKMKLVESNDLLQLFQDILYLEMQNFYVFEIQNEDPEWNKKERVLLKKSYSDQKLIQILHQGVEFDYNNGVGQDALEQKIQFTSLSRCDKQSFGMILLAECDLGRVCDVDYYGNKNQKDQDKYDTLRQTNRQIRDEEFLFTNNGCKIGISLSDASEHIYHLRRKENIRERYILIAKRNVDPKEKLPENRNDEFDEEDNSESFESFN